MLNAALSGELIEVEYEEDPVFGFSVPKSCPGVPEEVLNPAIAWTSHNVYMTHYRELAKRFIDNFRKFEDSCTQDIIDSGPKLQSPSKQYSN
jgi:phosphoenolpyruvate carboxykinase (ATP)